MFFFIAFIYLFNVFTRAVVSFSQNNYYITNLFQTSEIVAKPSYMLISITFDCPQQTLRMATPISGGKGTIL